ncbi:MAG: IPT/TIG domain-containing protein, partial [Bryobacteraceae bacterium]
AESYAAGQLVAIRGREFALVERVAEQVRDEIAWPSQLEGLAVRIGGRFAALRYVSPGEIVAEIPAGLVGETADVVVITGPQSESAPVSLRLAAQ